jgi:hypothetical protein
MLKALAFLSGLALSVTLCAYEVPAKASLPGNALNHHALTGNTLTSNARSAGSAFVVACMHRPWTC